MSGAIAPIDPRNAASRRRVLGGRLSLEDLARLAPLLAEPSGDVTYRLEFAATGRMVEVHLRLAAELRLCCQRCLEVYPLPVAADVRLRMVSGPLEAERLDPEFEPLLMEEGALLDPRDLIEDELLLAVPQVPRHPEGLCPSAWIEILQEEGRFPERANPFAALANYKT